MIAQFGVALLNDVDVMCARHTFAEETAIGVLRIVDEGVAQITQRADAVDRILKRGTAIMMSMMGLAGKPGVAVLPV